MVKSNNEIGKVNDKKNLIGKFWKKVLTDGLDLGLDVQAHMKCHLDKYPTLVLVST